MKNKKIYTFKILLSAIILVLILGCGENAKGKDEKAEKAGKNTKARLLLPDFSLLDLDGNEFRLIDNVGEKPILMVFWTTNCPYCIREIPMLNKIFIERQKDIKVVSIDILQPLNMVRHFVNSKGIRYPVLLDNKGLTARAYRIRGVPSYVVVDLEGGMRYYGNDLNQAMQKINDMLT